MHTSFPLLLLPFPPLPALSGVTLMWVLLLTAGTVVHPSTPSHHRQGVLHLLLLLSSVRWSGPAAGWWAVLWHLAVSCQLLSVSIHHKVRVTVGMHQGRGWRQKMEVATAGSLERSP